MAFPQQLSLPPCCEKSVVAKAHMSRHTIVAEPKTETATRGQKDSLQEVVGE
jgi:hypothetical protein